MVSRKHYLLLLMLMSLCLLAVTWYSGHIRSEAVEAKMVHNTDEIKTQKTVFRNQYEQPSGEDTPPHTAETIRICKNEERKQVLDDYCKKHGAFTDKNKNHLDLRQRVYRMIVDDTHKVLFCLHAKVGCSTWKTIIANNTSYYPFPADADMIGIHSNLPQYNVSFLHDNKFSAKDIYHRLHNYYKVMVVRHPYDRLNSFFNQKFIHGNGSVNRTMGRQVMNAYHPELPREVRKAGNITFSDITHWIQDGHIDSHFDGPYLKKCDPCFVNYDYVVKLESQPEDSAYIIKNKLQGRGVGTALNVQRDTSSNNPLLSSSGKKLNIFKNLTVEQMQFMHDRLQPDLDMFGYTFDETNLLAKCGYENKDCC